MNKTEFSKVADAIRTYYPKDNPFPTPAAMQLWYEEFKDLPYEVVVIGLRRHVNTSKWCPTIAELKEAIVVNTAGDKDWGASWDECLKAIGRFGQYQEAEALDSMSPITREVVTRIGFKELCRSENQMQDRANFRMIFEQVTGNEYDKAALPKGLQESIAKIGCGAPQLEERNGID